LIWNHILFLDRGLVCKIIEVIMQGLQVWSLGVKCLWWLLAEVFQFALSLSNRWWIGRMILMLLCLLSKALGKKKMVWYNQTQYGEQSSFFGFGRSQSFSECLFWCVYKVISLHLSLLFPCSLPLLFAKVWANSKKKKKKKKSPVLVELIFQSILKAVSKNTSIKYYTL
jgi:hypothetical protein